MAILPTPCAIKHKGPASWHDASTAQRCAGPCPIAHSPCPGDIQYIFIKLCIICPINATVYRAFFKAHTIVISPLFLSTRGRNCVNTGAVFNICVHLYLYCVVYGMSVSSYPSITVFLSQQQQRIMCIMKRERERSSATQFQHRLGATRRSSSSSINNRTRILTRVVSTMRI